MKKIVCICFAAIVPLILFGKENHDELAVKNIPESLKYQAHAVFRFDSSELNIVDMQHVIHKRNYAVTILDERGLPFSKMVNPYNKSITVENMDAILLDANGKEIKSLKNRDIKDISAYGTSYVFNDDYRFKFFDFECKTYPYTIIFQVETKINTTFFLPQWNIPVSDINSVENAKFTVTFPSDMSIRHKEYQMPEGLLKTEAQDAKGIQRITWQVSNLGVLTEQPNAHVGDFEKPTVVLSPSQFKFFSNTGDMSSWQAMGAFFYKLNEGRDELPEDKKQMIQALVANEHDEYSKIQKLYNYMQQSTRYVADEYGISAFQTFTATDVAKMGYGDCKGLVNYLKALLKAVNIKAYTTLVYAGSEDYLKLDQSFPSNIFNHVILCIPQPKDSIWVECTSQQLPAGYLGNFTQNRDVLLTTENGGFLVHTPIYDQTKNYAVRKAVLQLDVNNKSNQTIHITNTYYGPMSDNMSAIVKTKSNKEINEILNKKFPFPTYIVEKYNYKPSVDDNHIPSLTEDVDVNVSGIINGTQKRTFINIAWMKNPMDNIFQVEPRTLPIVLDKSFAITDSVIVQLPIGTELESVPSDNNLIHPFATYKVHFEKNENTLILIRTFMQNAGKYDAKLYDDYQKMYKSIESEKNKLNIVALNKAS